MKQGEIKKLRGRAGFVSRAVLEGNVAVFKNCEGLMHLSCVANGVDCDALGSLKTTLKDCDLIVST